MKVLDALAVAQTRSRAVPSCLFVNRREFRELWQDLKENFPGSVPSLGRMVKSLKIDDHFTVWDCETSDMDIVREANRFEMEEYARRLYALRAGSLANPA